MKFVFICTLNALSVSPTLPFSVSPRYVSYYCRALLLCIIIIVIIVVFSGADLMRPYCHVIARQTVERARIVQSFFGDT